MTARMNNRGRRSAQFAWTTLGLVVLAGLLLVGCAAAPRQRGVAAARPGSVAQHSEDPFNNPLLPDEVRIRMNAAR